MLERTNWNRTNTEMTRSSDSMNRFFDRFFSGDLYDTESLASSRWTPPMDVCENEDHYEITAELPGLTKDDIDVTLENNLLTVSGERRFDNESKKQNYRRIERRYGNFSRSFSLPSQVDGENVKASFQDGILRLTVPKREEAKPRKIDVQ